MLQKIPPEAATIEFLPLALTSCWLLISNELVDINVVKEHLPTHMI